MFHALLRYLVLLAGITVTGLIGATAATAAWSPRGQAGPLVTAAERPLLAIILLVVALVAMVAVSGLAGRLVNGALGLFVLGAGLTTMAMRSGTLSDIVFGQQSLGAIGFETMAWGVALVPATAALLVISGPLRDMQTPGARTPWLTTALRGPAWTTLACGVLAVVLAWIVLRTDMKGQSIAAAIIGGMVTGLAGRLWHPRIQPVVVVAAPVVVIGLVQVILGMRLGGGVVERFATGSLPRLLAMMPADVAGGCTVGVALGLGWAKSFLHESDERTTAPSPA